MGTHHNQVALNLPISDAFRTKCQEWAAALYSSTWQDTPRHTDQFVDSNLAADTSGEKKIVLTRFGREATGADSLSKSFWCITGNDLYTYMPWYQPMEDFLETNASLTSHLAFPCLLITNGYVRKHPDVGRKTVFNFDIFGSEKLIWGHDGDADPATYDIESDSNSFTETYSYTPNEVTLVNVAAIHGANKIDGHDSYSRCAVNHGFMEDFSTVSSAFATMAGNGKLTELQNIIDEA